MSDYNFNETFDFTDVTCGLDFASRIFTPESHDKLVTDNKAFFSKMDPEYIDFFVGMYALNQAHYFEAPLNYNYAGILEAATVLRGVIDSEYRLETDVEVSHSFCDSPWQEITDNPQNYVAIIARFDMETDESEIDIDQLSGNIDSFRESCYDLRDNGIDPSVIVSEIIDHLLDEDRLELNAKYVPALRAFRDELLSR